MKGGSYTFISHIVIHILVEGIMESRKITCRLNLLDAPKLLLLCVDHSLGPEKFNTYDIWKVFPGPFFYIKSIMSGKSNGTSCIYIDKPLELT